MIVAGTEQAHLIPRNAHGQRAGVLGVLSDLGETLRLLPDLADCAAQINLSEWSARRQGWIFITSTTDSREALRPLQAVFINILMKRLMSVSPEWGQTHPCWLVVDEVHSLHRLPALYEAETEGRKYGLKLIQGTQGKPQYEEYYQTLAKTMLAAPRLKLFFRCGEPESARWISDMIGEVEIERPKIGTTASVEDKGRDSLNYSTITEHKSVVSKEQIMSLSDLHGYWKYGDAVVPFRLPLAPVRIVARGYVRRKLTAPEAASASDHADVVLSEEEHREVFCGDVSDTIAEVRSASALDGTPTIKRSIKPAHPDQRLFEFKFDDKQGLETKQREHSNTEAALFTRESAQAALATEEGQDETSDSGKRDSQLKLDQMF
ncbi:MAG TPA: type IV secretion system DNA-binding domain-containing protein [Pyrinomonadaceae bacterium]